MLVVRDGSSVGDADVNNDVMTMMPMIIMMTMVIIRVAITVPACQPSGEAKENLRGNLRTFEEI